MTITRTRTIMAAGYVPLDIVSYNGRVWHAAGGTAGNVAAILSFLGARASVVAELGDDLAGQRVRRDLQKANVDTSHLLLNPRVRTPRLIHRIAANGHYFEFRCPACERSFPTSRPLTISRADRVAVTAKPPDVCFIDRLNHGTIRLAEQLHESGARVVYEPSRPAKPELERRLLAIARLVKFAHDRRPDLERVEPQPGQTWIQTCGAEGARFRVGKSRWRTSPAFSFPVVDAGGAGDWTTAGLVHTIDLKSRASLSQVGDALRWSQALAAVSCGAPGARGLARQQTAEDVLRSAHFLDQRGASNIPTGTLNWRRNALPEGVCGWCLERDVELNKPAVIRSDHQGTERTNRESAERTPPRARGGPAA